MTNASQLLLDSFKLPTTFSAGGVVHYCPGRSNQVWTDISVLGHGNPGTVYLQQLQRGPPHLLRAVKELSQVQRRASLGHVMRELNMMIAVRDNEDLFVKLFGWFQNPRGSLFLAMEYVPHGDLAMYIMTTRDDERDAREVTRQLLTGLSVLHSRRICHRDLKPQNVLVASLTPIKVKLADFGISKSTDGTTLRTRIGTAQYMAPEQLGLLPARLRLGNEYTTAVDMWALGFIVHQLLTGSRPFLEAPMEELSSGYLTDETGEMATDMRLLLQFCDGSVVLPLHLLQDIKAPESAIQLIRSLIVPDPRSRSSAAQALLDPWITGHQPSPDPAPQANSLDPLVDSQLDLISRMQISVPQPAVFQFHSPPSATPSSTLTFSSSEYKSGCESESEPDNPSHESFSDGYWSYWPTKSREGNWTSVSPPDVPSIVVTAPHDPACDDGSLPLGRGEMVRETEPHGLKDTSTVPASPHTPALPLTKQGSRKRLHHEFMSDELKDHYILTRRRSTD